MWKLKQLDNDPEMFVIVADDGTAYIAGEIHEVLELTKRLVRFNNTGQTDGTISHLDESLGVKWLDALEAEASFGVARATATLACRAGKITGAEKHGNRWRFPMRTFLAWLRRDERQ